MKILNISPGNGWLSRWKHIGIDNQYMLREVIVFAAVGNSSDQRLTSFSGPTNNFSCPDDQHDPFDNPSFPWQFIGWQKPEVPAYVFCNDSQNQNLL